MEVGSYGLFSWCFNLDLVALYVVSMSYGWEAGV